MSPTRRKAVNDRNSLAILSGFRRTTSLSATEFTSSALAILIESTGAIAEARPWRSNWQRSQARRELAEARWQLHLGDERAAVAWLADAHQTILIDLGATRELLGTGSRQS